MMRGLSLFQSALRRLRRRRTKQQSQFSLFFFFFFFVVLYDSFNSDGVPSSRVKIFDRDLKRKQRDRAAWLMRNPNDSFVGAVAENVLVRLEDCKKSLPAALCLGGSAEPITRLLNGRGKKDVKFIDVQV